MIVLVLLALIVPFFIPGAGKQEGVDPNANLPWQIAVDGQGGSTVFEAAAEGLSTLGEVRQKLGNEIEVAIIAETERDRSARRLLCAVAARFRAEDGGHGRRHG